jgi:hypothetical protein
MENTNSIDNSNSECVELNNNDLDKTIVNTDTIIETSKIPIDVIPNLDTTIINENTTSTTSTTTQSVYRDVVEDNINNMTHANMACAGDIVLNLAEQEKKKSVDSVSAIPENNEKIVTDVVEDERGGIVYDLIHILDDIYSYGRTLIENNYFNFANNDDFNLIYPNVYIGNYSTSTNLELLKGVGITHILSVIPTFNPPFLDKFTYLHIPAYDDQSQDLKQYFAKSNEFIAGVLNQGGKVLIHCMVGRSRSVSIFIAFLINIIQGNLNQAIVKLDADNDVSNELEYKQFGNFKYTKHKGVRDVAIASNRQGNGNGNTDGEFENITKLEFQAPQLSNKYRNFMIYKKETMINEIEELIGKYEIMKQDLNILVVHNNIDISSKKFKELKQQFSNNFIVLLLKYIKKYRKVAEPNLYFITQLTDTIL